MHADRAIMLFLSRVGRVMQAQKIYQRIKSMWLKTRKEIYLNLIWFDYDYVPSCHLWFLMTTEIDVLVVNLIYYLLCYSIPFYSCKPSSLLLLPLHDKLPQNISLALATDFYIKSIFIYHPSIPDPIWPCFTKHSQYFIFQPTLSAQPTCLSFYRYSKLSSPNKEEYN